MFTCRYCFLVSAEEGGECEISISGLHAPKTYHLPGGHDQQSHAGGGSKSGNNNVKIDQSWHVADWKETTRAPGDLHVELNSVLNGHGYHIEIADWQ